MSKKLFQGEALQLQMLASGVAELIFDLQGESVNKFNLQMVSELGQILDLIEADSNIKGLLLTTAKKMFIVGADIGEFSGVFAAGADKIESHLATNNKNFNRLEDLHCPVVIAIRGYALGGGMELALACDCRVASESAVLGQPEVKLGIIPGWGGTVRLPRLTGLDTAVEWIASGREYKAQQAFKAGVVDAVVAEDRLQAAALHLLQECMQDRFDYGARRALKTSPLQHNDIEAMLAFESSKGFIAAKAGRHYPAPVAAIAAMQKAAKSGREQALIIEAKTFSKMAQTDVAIALVSLFMRDQALTKKSKQLIKNTDTEIAIDRIAVLGAGIMGGGIAYQAAIKKIPVSLKDVRQEGLDLGLAEAANLLTQRLSKARITAVDMAATLNRIEPTLSYDNFDRVDLVVEAVVENPDIKKAVLVEAEAQLKVGAVLASNTSTISITSLAANLQRPEDFCGMHFFNPVHKMPLVEVIRGAKTSAATLAKTVALATQMGKKVVVVEDCPGFLVNRILFPYFSGFSRLLHDGADYQQIDKVMLRWGWPMGPAHLLDVVGLDTAVHAEKVMAQGYPERMTRDFTSAIETLVGKKRLGQKSGAGFYRYEPDKKGKLKAQPDADILPLLYAVSDGETAASTEFSDEEIFARMMIPMATELARCLEEGIVATAAEADMALVYGIGFPPFRAGIFHWLDHIGLQEFCEMAAPFTHLGALYQPTENMQKMAVNGDVYYAKAGGQQ